MATYMKCDKNDKMDRVTSLASALERLERHLQKPSIGIGNYKDIRTVAEAARTQLAFEEWMKDAEKVGKLIRLIDRLKKDNPNVNENIWMTLKLLAMKYQEVPPKDVTLDSFRCPSCRMITVLTWGTEHYHCPKCGQKIKAYDEQGLWGLSHGSF